MKIAIATAITGTGTGTDHICLPNAMILANYPDLPQNIIHAIIEANITPTDFIADEIIRRSRATANTCSTWRKTVHAQ